MKHKLKNVSKTTDLRVIRTADYLNKALAKLLQGHRSYDQIRVSNIARKANVGRATFYAHFEDKDALLKMQLEQVISRYIHINSNEPFVIDATALFAHLIETPQIHRSLTKGSNGTEVLKTAQKILEERIRDAAVAKAILVSGIRARFVAASLFTLIDWWVENGMIQSPSEMQRALMELTTTKYNRDIFFSF